MSKRKNETRAHKEGRARAKEGRVPNSITDQIFGSSKAMQQRVTGARRQKSGH